MILFFLFLVVVRNKRKKKEVTLLLYLLLYDRCTCRTQNLLESLSFSSSDIIELFYHITSHGITSYCVTYYSSYITFKIK